MSLPLRRGGHIPCHAGETPVILRRNSVSQRNTKVALGCTRSPLVVPVSLWLFRVSPKPTAHRPQRETLGRAPGFCNAARTPGILSRCKNKA